MPRLADFLEREGGSVVAAFVLLFVGWGMWMSRFPQAEQVVMIAVGAIAMALKGKASRVTVPAPPPEPPLPASLPAPAV